ncbi:MAG: hypothetical protein CL608_30940 [Anaerolineaceae bacterium]|nr:hypothetical protein [Anaerolineaceae bacterium]
MDQAEFNSRFGIFDGAICPLSATQQQESIEAFKEMVPTFQHPRCANCHGGGQPFQANTDHAGGKFDLVLDADGSVLTEPTFAECQSCHGGLPGWEIPRSRFSFVGKDAVELCQQMKGELGRADKFIDHIARDLGGTPFIATAFAGMRGLNEDGIDYYEALNDRKPVPEPPPISYADLINQAQAWVDAMGGEFKGDDGCGCEPQKYALQIDESLVAAFVSENARIDWDGQTQVQIPLTFKDDGTFTGEATSSRTMSAVLTAEVGCSGSSTSNVQWQVNGRLDSEERWIYFSVRFTPSMGSVSCNMSVPLPNPVQLPIPIDDSENPNNPLKQMEMSAYVGETETVKLNTNVVGSDVTDTFVITIIKLE